MGPCCDADQVVGVEEFDWAGEGPRCYAGLRFEGEIQEITKRDGGRQVVFKGSPKGSPIVAAFPFAEWDKVDKLKVGQNVVNATGSLFNNQIGASISLNMAMLAK